MRNRIYVNFEDFPSAIIVILRIFMKVIIEKIFKLICIFVRGMIINCCLVNDITFHLNDLILRVLLSILFHTS